MIYLSDLLDLLGIFVLGGIGWFTYQVYIWPYYISPLRKLPGPPSDSLIYGNFKRFLVEEVKKDIYIYLFVFTNLLLLN